MNLVNPSIKSEGLEMKENGKKEMWENSLHYIFSRLLMATSDVIFFDENHLWGINYKAITVWAHVSRKLNAFRKAPHKRNKNWVRARARKCVLPVQSDCTTSIKPNKTHLSACARSCLLCFRSSMSMPLNDMNDCWTSGCVSNKL